MWILRKEMIEYQKLCRPHLFEHPSAYLVQTSCLFELILCRHKNGGLDNAALNPRPLTSKENQYRTSAHKRARTFHDIATKEVLGDQKNQNQLTRVWFVFLHNLCLDEIAKFEEIWVSDWPSWVSNKRQEPYILKAGHHCTDQTPQTIWIFRRKIVWEHKIFQFCNMHFYAFLCILCILCIFMHYYASILFYAFILFPHIFWNWKAQSADFIPFRMYDKI